MNPYEILELPEGASPEAIKAAYHRLAKQWHPDKFSGDAKLEAELRFRQLAEAFGMLKDVVRGGMLASTPAPQVQDVKIDLQDESNTPKVRNAGDWFQEAKDCFDQHDFQKALSLVHYAIRLDATKAEYYELLAKAIARTSGDKKAEAKALETAIKLNPKNVDILIQLAELFQSVGMYARATRLWDAARNLEPGHRVFAKKSAAKTQNKVGNLQESLKDQWAGLRLQCQLLLDRIKTRR